MSQIKKAIEIKYPRYVVSPQDPSGCQVAYAHSGETVCFASGLEMSKASNIVTQHNELIDKLVEAAELLAELAPQAVETTPQVCKRWRP